MINEERSKYKQRQFNLNALHTSKSLDHDFLNFALNWKSSVEICNG